MSEFPTYIISGGELMAQTEVATTQMVAEPPKEHVREASLTDPAFMGTIAVIGAFSAFAAWADR